MTDSQTPFECARYIVDQVLGCRIQFAVRMQLVQLIERAIHRYSPAAARMAECEQLARCLLTRLADVAEAGDEESELLLRRGRLFFAELTDR